MAKIEREYNIPLRREFQKVPCYKRAKKAVKAAKEFLVKHMKSEDVKLGKHLNEKIWERGIKNPPHHVLVVATKDDQGKVYAELKELPVQRKTKIEQKRESVIQKEEAAKSALEKAKEEIAAKKDSAKPKEDKPKKEAKTDSSNEKVDAPKKSSKKESSDKKE
jgi:large subunit ribosomal protein L31e